jgi:hypothetical protein
MLLSTWSWHPSSAAGHISWGGRLVICKFLGFQISMCNFWEKSGFCLLLPLQLRQYIPPKCWKLLPLLWGIRNQKENPNISLNVIKHQQNQLVFWVVTPCGLVGGYCFRGICYSKTLVMYLQVHTALQPRGSMFLWNVGTYLQVCAMLQPRRPTSKSSLLREPKISYSYSYLLPSILT